MHLPITETSNSVTCSTNNNRALLSPKELPYNNKNGSPKSSLICCESSPYHLGGRRPSSLTVTAAKRSVVADRRRLPFLSRSPFLHLHPVNGSSSISSLRERTCLFVWSKPQRWSLTGLVLLILFVASTCSLFINSMALAMLHQQKQQQKQQHDHHPF